MSASVSLSRSPRLRRTFSVLTNLGGGPTVVVGDLHHDQDDHPDQDEADDRDGKSLEKSHNPLPDLRGRAGVITLDCSALSGALRP